MSNSILVKSSPNIRVSSVKADNITRVASVVIGRPVRRVTQAAVTIDAVQGVDTTGKVDGSVLVYNASTEKFEATLDLENQNINGGSF